jgi:hypothetical protein
MPKRDRDEDEREILYRLDERTENIDREMRRINQRTTRVEDRLEAHDIAIDANRSNIRRNTTILNAVTFGIGGAVAAFWAWLQGLLHI